MLEGIVDSDDLLADVEIIAHGIKLSKRQSAWPIYSVPCGEDEPFSASRPNCGRNISIRRMVQEDMHQSQ